MFDKKIKVQGNKKAICGVCGLECLDRDSLDRHVNWAHREQKESIKS